MQRHYPLNPATGLEDAALLPWANGNPGTGSEGSYPPFGLFTDPQDEILNAIAGSGQAVGSTLSQLLQALSRGIFVGTFAGSANALTAALPGSVVIPALTAGMRFSGIVGTANPGSSTLTLTGFTAAPGAKALTRGDASALQQNDLVVGQLITVVYDGTQFQIQHTSTAFIKSYLQAHSPGSLIQQLVFTASGTYTPSAGTQLVFVEGVGGGGGGSGCTQPGTGNVSLGAPGTSATYARGLYTIAQIGSSQAITIGAAGSGGALGAGTNGGITSLGSLLTIPGGLGGGAALNNQSPPTTTANGNISSAATGGLFSRAGTASSAAIALNAAIGNSGSGGESPFGAGGYNKSANAIGANATGYGAGGAGTMATSTQGNTGGNGSPGILIITEYGVI